MLNEVLEREVLQDEDRLKYKEQPDDEDLLVKTEAEVVMFPLLKTVLNELICSEAEVKEDQQNGTIKELK